jgi:Protein of unknown function (DUF3352)
MTDDLTRPTEPQSATEPAAPTEATTPPAGTEPVVKAAAPGPSRMRWAVGIGVAALAVVGAIGAYILLGSRPMPEALKYIPGDAVAVAEVRMDLPGDQLQKLGNLLAHFPGFADQSTLSAKIDESLSRLVRQGGDTEIDYVRDIKPWLSGPAFIAFSPPGPAGSGQATMDRGVVSATTTGTVSCATPLKGQAVTSETYRGLQLSIASSGDVACVIDGRQALIGDPASVRGALDAKANGTGMDRSDAYGAARARLQGDQLSTVFVNGKGYRASVSSAHTETPLMADLSLLTEAIPDWAITGIRAEDDALVLDSFAAPAPDHTPGATAGSSMLPLPPTHASVIAPLAPANTIVYAEAQGAGAGLQNFVARLRTLPNVASAFQMLDGMGGAGPLVGWIEDAGIIVVNGPQTPTGGIALVAADDAAAADKVKTLLGLVAFAGLGSNGVQTRESTIAGVTVTTITISNLSALVPPGQLPPGVDVPSDAKVEFSIAAKGRVILVGSGEDFMTAVLGTQPGSSLAEQAGYKLATSRALANSRGTVYVAIHDIVGLAETFLPADEKAKWEGDLKPYITPFQALSITSTSDASGSHQRLAVTVSQP